MSNLSPVKRFHHQCLRCLLDKHSFKVELARDDNTRLAYLQGLFKILAEAKPHQSPPEIIENIAFLQKDLLGYEESFEAEKKHFNALMLSAEPMMQDAIDSAEDKFKMAFNLAMIGNYIDFGAMDSVDEAKLYDMIKSASSLNFESGELSALKKDLESGKNLIYLTDNCGEIVADKLFIKTILDCYPHINAEVLVKGAPVLNDATMTDAAQVGLMDIVAVSHNGCGMAGTCLERISAKSREKIDTADIIIAKGQANFETMRHCGKNAYYIFMCKCDMFAERFNLPKFSGIILNDFRL